MAIEVQSVIEKKWEPNAGKQALFLSLPDSIFEQFFGGSAGPGKTEALMMKPLLRQWTDNKRFQGIILRRTYKELEESIIERSKRGGRNKDGTEIPSFYDFGAEYNEQKKRWKWPSGGTITFGHAEEESDVRKYDTSEYQYVAFDELTSFTEFQYKFLAFSRCRSSDSSLPPNVCSASNPGNIGHRWVRERFVEPCPKGGKIIAEKVGDQLIKRIFIQAFLTDNPRLMENDPLYKSRLEMLPEAEKRAKLYGDWWTFSGQVFSEWRAEHFPDEPANAIHTIPPFTPDKRYPRVLAIDWGYKAMTYALLGVPLPKRCTTIYKEFHTNKETVKSWATDLANICLLEGINPYITLDPSAWQNRGQGTISDEFSAAWRDVYNKPPLLEKADNNRISGKMLVHEYLRWKTRSQIIREVTESYDSEKASWILRNNGLDAYKIYLNQFNEQPDTFEETLPRLQVTSDCKLLTKIIPLCIYDEKNGEDVKEFDGDDPYDCIRYYLKRIDRFNLKAEDYQGPEDFAGNAQDINAFYRRMEMLEAKKNLKKQKFISIGRMGKRRAGIF